VKEETPEQLAAIRQRQLGCKHAFIRGMADTVARCTRCGMSKPDYDTITTHWMPNWVPHP
jgi:hypothetical protein